MTEPTQLLHNMSAPPKSVVKYAGLADAAKTIGPGGSGVCSVNFVHDGIFGEFIAFRLVGHFRRFSSARILKELGATTDHDPDKALLELIEERAQTLPLPRACVVVPTHRDHPCPLPDPLTALTMITKSSTYVWLRSKTPRLSNVKRRGVLSVLVPPNFVSGIEGLFA